MKRVGIEPQFIIEIIDDLEVSRFFGKAEYTAERSPFSGPVLPLVEAFTPYSSVAKTDGFGSLETITVTFNDFFGWFKETLETKDIRSFKAKLYLVVNQPPSQPVVTLLLDGRISDPVEWDEKQRNIELGMIANVIFDEFGYSPDWPEHDWLQRNLTGSPWPHVFGGWGTHAMLPICNVPQASLAKGIVIQSEGSDGEFFPYEDTDAYTIYKDGEDTFLNLFCDELGGFPHTSEGKMFYHMAIPGGTLLFRAHNLSGFLKMDSAADWNVPMYANIGLWSPQQFNGLLPYQQDDENYIPNVVTMMGYGTPDPYPGFNIYGELTRWPVLISDAFPYIGFNPDQEPWLSGMYIFFQAFRIYTELNDERVVEYEYFWARVADQNGLSLILDEITDVYGNETTLSDYRPCFVYYAAGNKVFYPSTATALCGGGSAISQGPAQGRWPEPPVKGQRGSSGKGSYFPRPDASGEYDRVYHIEAGTNIKPVDWWPTMIFPVSLDLETTIQSVSVKVGNRLIFLNVSQYIILKYNKQAGLDSGDVTDAWEVVTGGLSGPPWVPPILWSMHQEYMPDECIFVYLRPSVFLTMARDIANTDVAQLYVTCKNAYNTDERVFKYVTEKYTTYTASENPDIYYHHPVNFIVRKQEPVPSIIGRLAWEHAKLIKVQVNHASMVDLLSYAPEKLARFDESNIENGALRLVYTAEEEVRNYIEATPMDGWSVGKMIVRNKESIDKLTEIGETVEIGFNRIFSTPTELATVPPNAFINSHWPETEGESILIPPEEEGDPPTYENQMHFGRGYNRVLRYWLDDYSNEWLVLNFNTFIDSIHFNGNLLVGSDIVDVFFRTALDFIAPEEGIPLNVLPPYGGGALPQSRGLILELTIDPTEWTISMAVKLPIKMGTNVPRYVVEE